MLTNPASTPPVAEYRGTDMMARLEKRRRLLETILTATQTIERLQKSMQNVLCASDAKLPVKTSRLFVGLAERIKDKSTTQLTGTLSHVDNMIQHDLAQIMEFTSTGEGLPVPPGELPLDPNLEREIEEISGLVQAFRRRTQTSVFLRVFLRERGVHSAPLSVTVPRDIIQDQIKKLASQEKQCRGRLKVYIRNTLAELKDMQAQTLPDAVREQLCAIHQGLNADLAHLESGRSLDSLPFTLEMVELHEQEGEFSDPLKDPDSIIDPEPFHPVVPGLVRSFWLWLSSPWGVGWTDIRKGRYQGRG